MARHQRVFLLFQGVRGRRRLLRAAPSSGTGRARLNDQIAVGQTAEEPEQQGSPLERRQGRVGEDQRQGIEKEI